MSKSSLLRARDLRAAYRLIGDCRDLGANPASWHRRAFEGLRELIGAPVGVGGEGVWLRPKKPLRPLTCYDVGFDEASRHLHFQFLREKGLLADPIFRQLQRMSGRIVTRTRRELVEDREWYHSVSFNDFRRVGGCDDALTSIYQTSVEGAISTLSIHRAVGDRGFSPRERRLMRFFHIELGRLIGGPLVSALEPGIETLSPRLRQTLECLLEGDSEKAIASRLGLSPATVHQYVTALYRTFGVRSRSQLMVYALRRRRWGRLENA